jgi:hypothetical protein
MLGATELRAALAKEKTVSLNTPIQYDYLQGFSYVHKGGTSNACYLLLRLPLTTA